LYCSAWLTDNQDVRIEQVSQRAHAAMNLTLDSVEELQVYHLTLVRVASLFMQH